MAALSAEISRGSLLTSTTCWFPQIKIKLPLKAQVQARGFPTGLLASSENALSDSALLSFLTWALTTSNHQDSLTKILVPFIVRSHLSSPPLSLGINDGCIQTFGHCSRKTGTKLKWPFASSILLASVACVIRISWHSTSENISYK